MASLRSRCGGGCSGSERRDGAGKAAELEKVVLPLWFGERSARTERKFGEVVTLLWVYRDCARTELESSVRQSGSVRRAIGKEREPSRLPHHTRSLLVDQVKFVPPFMRRKATILYILLCQSRVSFIRSRGSSAKLTSYSSSSR
jgi:hypothetical protein